MCLSAHDVEAAESCGLGVANVFVVGLVATPHGTTLCCVQDYHSFDEDIVDEGLAGIAGDVGRIL